MINFTKKGLPSAEHFASFPEQNPSPVIEVDRLGNVKYINPVAKGLFPNLKSRGIRHQFLVGIEKFFNKKTATREVSLNGYIFQQIIKKIPDTQLYRIYCNDITESKKTAALLLKNLSRLKEAEHLGNFGHWEWDAKADKITWSEEYYRILGYNPKKDPPNYKDHLKVYTPETAKILDLAVKKAMSKGTPYELDLEFNRTDGRRGWITARAEAIRNEKNKIIGLRGTAQDITARKILELEREQFFKFFNLSTDIMVFADPNGCFKKVNPTCISVFGYSEKELLSKPFVDFVHPDDKQSTLDEMARQIKIGYTLHFENRYLCKNGKVLWLAWKAIYKKEDKTTYATARDITVAKNAEKELNTINRALLMINASNQALIHINDEKLLLETIGEIVIKKGGYRFMWIGYANQDEAKTVHPVIQVGIGTNYFKSAKITWADTERGRGPTGTAIRTGKTNMSRDIQNDARMKPWKSALKTRGCKSSIALPLTNEGNTIGALMIYSEEINGFSDKEIQILEELSNDLAFGISTLRLREKIEERTKEVDQLKNKFIQIVAHQLRTPLNVIRWDLETILNRERGEIQPAQVEILRGAHSANIDIISRLDDLLTAIDIEEGRIRTEMETVKISDLFQSICEEKLQKCNVKNIRHKLIMPKTPLPLIKLDSNKIRDVLTRLIDNAITYTNDGGSIVVKLSFDSKKIRFEISDTGVGIPNLEQAHIFERFHRGWNASQMRPDASGLSLYIAKQFIKVHNGEIGFTSKENKGSTFWFELPIKK